jgi:hypothetical protein
VERKRKSRAAKAAREKGEEPAKDKTHKKKAKKRKLTGSVSDCEHEAAVDSGSEDEPVGATLFFVEPKLNIALGTGHACHCQTRSSQAMSQRTGGASTYDHPRGPLVRAFMDDLKRARTELRRAA